MRPNTAESYFISITHHQGDNFGVIAFVNLDKV